MTDGPLLTLDAAARLAFPNGGADAGTLKRRARQGKLTVYKPGKQLLTTLADVQRMVAACRVEQKAQGSGSGRHTAIASAALERELANLEKPSAPLLTRK